VQGGSGYKLATICEQYRLHEGRRKPWSGKDAELSGRFLPTLPVPGEAGGRVDDKVRAPLQEGRGGIHQGREGILI